MNVDSFKLLLHLNSWFPQRCVDIVGVSTSFLTFKVNWLPTVWLTNIHHVESYRTLTLYQVTQVWRSQRDGEEEGWFGIYLPSSDFHKSTQLITWQYPPRPISSISHLLDVWISLLHLDSLAQILFLIQSPLGPIFQTSLTALWSASSALFLSKAMPWCISLKPFKSML